MSNNVRFGCYEVDLAAGQLYKHGLRINLRAKSFQVLTSLLEHPGQVVSREELRHRLWPEECLRTASSPGTSTDTASQTGGAPIR